MIAPRLYNGVRMVDAPCPANVRRLDMGVIPMVRQMQKNGLIVDLPYFDGLRVDLLRDMEEQEEAVRSLTGHFINIASGDQVADLLFNKLKLKQPRRKMTPSGDRESVESEVLESMKHLHPVVPILQEYKECEKLESTYVRPMKSMARKVGRYWRIFPNFRVTRVASGRLSTFEPNLMAIPTRSERGKKVRKGFIAPDGWSYVSVDESQIEMRVAAHRSQCKRMIDVFLKNGDIHKETASQIYRVPIPDLIDDQRYAAKRVGFGVLYDVTAMGLLDQMPTGKGWTEELCQELIGAWYGVYPEILQQRKRDHQTMRRFKMIWDMWGRIRHAQQVHSAHFWIVQAGLRECSNHPMQGGAQGTIKLTMAELHDVLTTFRMISPWAGYVVEEVLQIHDELLFLCRDDVVEELIALVGYIFENCVRGLLVPIKWGGSSAPTWGDLKK